MMHVNNNIFLIRLFIHEPLLHVMHFARSGDESSYPHATGVLIEEEYIIYVKIRISDSDRCSGETQS